MQFNRIYKLQGGKIGGRGAEISDLRIQFQIEKDTSKELNTAKFDIYNCAPVTRDLLAQTDSIVNFSCGYATDSAGLVRAFTGYNTFVKSELNGTDMITTIEAADGGVPVRDSVTVLSFAAGATGAQIVKKIAADMGLTLNVANDVVYHPHPNGFSFTGYARDALALVVNAANSEWMVLNSTLTIIKQRGSFNKRAFELSATSGLISSPVKIDIAAKTNSPIISINKVVVKDNDKTAQGWRVRCLLNAAINPGDMLKITSKAVDSWFIVDYIKHSGDTWGNDWISEMECYDVAS